MKVLIAAALAATGIALLSGCATMNEDQCQVGDWGGQGWRDGAAGYQASRLDEHARACAKYGVVPSIAAYMSAREEGLRTYCTWENGFREGRQGDTYAGVCSPADEVEFLPAYRDGRQIHDAEQAVTAAESALNSAVSRVNRGMDKLEAKQRELRQEGLTDEERQRIRERINEVREDIADARRDTRRAEDDLRYAEAGVRAVMGGLSRRYGVW